MKKKKKKNVLTENLDTMQVYVLHRLQLHKIIMYDECGRVERAVVVVNEVS